MLSLRACEWEILLIMHHCRGKENVIHNTNFITVYIHRLIMINVNWCHGSLKKTVSLVKTKSLVFVLSKEKEFDINKW